MDVHLIFSKEEIDLIRDVMFEHKISLKKERNKSDDQDERDLINDQIHTIEMIILPKLGDC